MSFTSSLFQVVFYEGGSFFFFCAKMIAFFHVCAHKQANKWQIWHNNRQHLCDFFFFDDIKALSRHTSAFIIIVCDLLFPFSFFMFMCVCLAKDKKIKKSDAAASFVLKVLFHFIALAFFWFFRVVFFISRVTKIRYNVLFTCIGMQTTNKWKV